MKIDISKGNIEVIGDVKEFKTSIDPKNLEYITTLLSSNLYSDPEQSFIREIVSNAWDSHVEAGTTDVPVIVKIDISNRSITIRDFGVGLSPERFRDIYCNIGSSTKRDSNEFIGGFGIGRFSALACSNSVYITSYYEGTAYYYIMVKSGNSITSNLLMSTPTTEKNGVEVSIKNVDICNYIRALPCITFFPNVYIDGVGPSFNNTKIKRFNNFAVASTEISQKILLGNVLYPIQDELFPIKIKGIIDSIRSTGIVIKFDIGELEITPNRENIIYSSNTIEKITSRIEATKAELDNLIYSCIHKDYDNIFDYYKATMPIGYFPIDNTINRYGGYRIDNDFVINNITYKGINLKSFSPLLRVLLTTNLPNFRFIISDGIFYSKKMPWALVTPMYLTVPKLLILNSGARINNVVKSYLKVNYDEYSVITEISEKEFIEYIRKLPINIKSDATTDLVIKGIYEGLMKKAKRLDLNNDPDFLKYKARVASNKIVVPKIAQTVILYSWQNLFRQKNTFNNFDAAIQYIKNLKRGIILAGMDVDTDTFSSIADLKRYVFIQARKDIVSSIKELNLKCIVDIEWLTKKDPNLSVVKTIIKHFPDHLNRKLLTSLSFNIEKKLYSKFYNLYKIDNSFGSNFYYRALALKDNIPYDSYTEYLCLKLKEYISQQEKVDELIRDSQCDDNIALNTAVVIKTKAYRVSSDAYNRYKNNKLLNVLCRK